MLEASTSPESSSAVSSKAQARGVIARSVAICGELAIVAFLVLCYDRVRNLAQVRRALSLHDGVQLLGFERHLHINVELPVNLWLAAHSELAELASWYYQLAHLTVTLLVLMICYVRRPAVYPSARNALVLINVIGLVCFWVYPVAPPRLLPGRAFIDVTEMTGVATASSTSAPNPYAAMPSLHTAWAVWVTCVALVLVRRRWARMASVLYPLLTVAVIVSTGNHYVLDVVGGVVVAFVGLSVAGLAPWRKFLERRSPDQETATMQRLHGDGPRAQREQFACGSCVPREGARLRPVSRGMTIRTRHGSSTQTPSVRPSALLECPRASPAETGCTSASERNASHQGLAPSARN
jgi:membrane-associated phospholipid phosphatase